jgi:MarC family membrane protein
MTEPVWIQLFSMAFALFLLMDPLGNVPIYVSVLKNIPAKRQRVIIARELLIALFVIILFQFLGDGLMRFLNVSMPTILISGGIILFLISIKMIFPVARDNDNHITRDKEPFIVPLAIPLVAGPAVLAAVMLYSGQGLNYWPDITGWLITTAIVIAWLASTVILLSCTVLERVLGKKGLTACERLMGLILTMISIQMLLEGIHLFMKSNGQS